MESCPVDIFKHIISYIYDIDIRRAFGIYAKLDLSKWKSIKFGYKRIYPFNRHPSPWLNTEFDEDGEPPQHISSQWLFNVDVYIYLHNLFDSEERVKNRIKNDFYEILLSEVKHGSDDFTKVIGIIHRYVPINHYMLIEPGSQRFYWKKIYVLYEIPHLHRNKKGVIFRI